MQNKKDKQKIKSQIFEFGNFGGNLINDIKWIIDLNKYRYIDGGILYKMKINKIELYNNIVITDNATTKLEWAYIESFLNFNRIPLYNKTIKTYNVVSAVTTKDFDLYNLNEYAWSVCIVHKAVYNLI